MSSELFRQTLPALIRQAQQVLEERSSPAAIAPAVMWQGAEEVAAVFVGRVRAARRRLTTSARLIAVCAGPQDLHLEGVTWCELPPKMLPLLHPQSPSRYRVAYGGRGGAKSWAFARALLARAVAKPIRVLCFRELQVSVAESVHRLLADQIETLHLDPWFTVQQTAIYGANGSEFVFAGVRNNVNKIRSLEGVDIAFGEEAVGVSENSWQVLIPTIRRPQSEIWAVFNPDLLTDPTYVRFITKPPDTARTLEVSFADNPWFPVELKSEEEYLARVDPDAHAHVWLGQPRAASDAQIFKGKYSIEAFEPQPGWDGPYLGADWGFAQDPTTAVKLWIHERMLYCEFEAFGVGVDIDRTPTLFDSIPDARKYVIRADSARPETISYMQRHEYWRMTSVEKWSGSVEDGIAFMRQFERIVVHPRCTHAADEMRLYSYKVDRLSGAILPEPVDKHNHIIDAIRYALQPLIRRGPGWGFLEYMKQEVDKLAAQKAQQA
ncbi:MAG: PBSX family phage terminase large subunit [Pseudomonadota bacterium]